MKNRKKRTLTALVASMVCIGIVSSLILSLPLLNQVSAQDETGEDKAGEDMDMMNTGSGVNTGSMNANMTMDQMLNMMDMMHNMMMNMMRMMAHGNMTSNMTTMAGMQ